MKGRTRSTALLVLLALSCRSLPPDSPSPRRVVLLSLDGAGASELHRLYREGKLRAGGFARFFEEGQVAEGLVPVNPTLTSTSHISLATGYVPGETGIVSNTFHPAGSPFLNTASGFSAAIGTETLWEAARRQGRRVGIAAWPGADATGERRRGDWGTVYVSDPDRRPAFFSFSRDDWRPADQQSGNRSPVLANRVMLIEPGSGQAQEQAQTFELLALDRDEAPGYDALAVGSPPASPPTDPVNVGQWGSTPCELYRPEGGSRRVACPFKVLAIAPDLSSVRIYFDGLYSLRAYPAELQERMTGQGLVWPGPPDDRSLWDTWQGRPGIDLATWMEQSERFSRYFFDTFLAGVARPDWDLFLGYTPVIDEAGHQLLLTDPRQPGFSPGRRDELAAARLRTWQVVDRELARLLAALDLSTTTVAVVSDHGMSAIHTALEPNVLLRERGLLATDGEGKVLEPGTAALAVRSGAVAHIHVAPGREDLLPGLRQLFTEWEAGGQRVLERVLSRSEAASVGLDHPNSGDLILFPHPGYTFASGLREGRTVWPTPVYGMHGHLNHHAEIHGLYMAVGAGIRKGSAGTVQGVDVAGRVAGWLGIEKPRREPPRQ
jgi:predicted AlkP superfamily pyrophosphatase or phosphodiesterase